MTPPINSVSPERLDELARWAASEEADCLQDDMPVSAGYYADIIKLIAARRAANTPVDASYRTSPAAEPVAWTDPLCTTCAGTGEVITDNERYLHPHDGDKGDEAVADCPDCDGLGYVEVADYMAANPDASEARPTACTGCGSMRTDEQCRVEQRSCCPDRHMVPVDDLIASLWAKAYPSPAVEAEPVATASLPEHAKWCQPGDRQDKRHFLVRFDDPDCRDSVFTDEDEARKFYARATLSWNCWLFGALPAHPAPPASREVTARPLDEWQESDGDVVWWCWRDGEWLGEPAYLGSPLNLGHTVECHTHAQNGASPAARFMVGGWPGYHTHWTPHPERPALLAALPERDV